MQKKLSSYYLLLYYYLQFADSPTQSLELEEFNVDRAKELQ